MDFTNGFYFILGVLFSCLLDVLHSIRVARRNKKEMSEMKERHAIEQEAMKRARIKFFCKCARDMGISPDEYLHMVEKHEEQGGRLFAKMVEEEKKKLGL